MKKIYLVLIAMFTLISASNASELSQAYQKEYAFLTAQKAELESRLNKEEVQQDENLEKASVKVTELQNKLLVLSSDVTSEKEALEKLATKLGESQDNGDIMGNIVSQAGIALEEYGIKIDDSNKTSDTVKLQQAFKEATKLYGTLSSLRNEEGEFYLPDGSVAKGTIVKVGNVAAYGISKKAAGALAPAGSRAYKLWNAVGSSDDAKALYAGEMTKELDIFVYENLDKEVAYVKEKTAGDTIQAGGIIGYIILGLGVFGLILLVLRVFVLSNAGSNVKHISQIVVDTLESGEGSTASLEKLKGYKGSTARVIKATLRNIKKERAHIEDVVMENILNESTTIDRFGSFVLVIAAVAPLLGLLGTVTGMIATFDIITEFGTGDPKLLSGGISEALVTTMLGLIVAIPLLLIGNLLSGWAQTIKDSMEQSALHIVNLYEKHKAI